MSKEYPLYPELSEDGKNEAQALIDRFKKQIKVTINSILEELYCDVVCHIESDSWQNYRNAMMDGFKDYNNRHVQAKWDFKKIREQIYNDFKDEITKDLNQDNLDKIKKLEEKLDEANKRYNDLAMRGCHE